MPLRAWARLLNSYSINQVEELVANLLSKPNNVPVTASQFLQVLLCQ